MPRIALRQHPGRQSALPPPTSNHQSPNACLIASTRATLLAPVSKCRGGPKCPPGSRAGKETTMKVETMASLDMTRTAADAERAERLGYDGVLTPETGHDPFLPLLLAGEHTSKLTLGTAVAIAFPRSPMVTAQLAWDLQKFTNGRFLLGLGTQVKGHNIRRYGTPWDSPPGPRLREYIQMIRAIWENWQNGTRPSFRGQHYEFTLMSPFFNPGPIEHPKIPIYISAVNTFNCRLAGE